MTVIEKIRSEIGQDVFDYTQLMAVLASFRKPRDAVTRLLEQKKILRIRKGLYIFGDIWRRFPVSMEMPASLIYGPSAVSLDYALSWYGLIPERTYVITSVTTGRSRQFQTPIGTYTYRQLSFERFSTGLTLQKDDGGNWFITEPLKALADKVWCDPRCRPISAGYFRDYLFSDLRIDEDQLKSFIDEISAREIAKAYASRKIDFLFEFLLSF